MSERKIQVRLTASPSSDCVNVVVFAEDGKALSGPDIVEVLETYITRLNKAIADDALKD